MSMSIRMKNVYKVAKEYDSKLQAGDKRFNNAVHILHEDGSVFHLDSAFLMRFVDEHPDQGDWIVVFAEHHPIIVFPESDLSGYRQYKIIHNIELLEV